MNCFAPQVEKRASSQSVTGEIKLASVARTKCHCALRSEPIIQTSSSVPRQNSAPPHGIKFCSVRISPCRKVRRIRRVGVRSRARTKGVGDRALIAPSCQNKSTEKEQIGGGA